MKTIFYIVCYLILSCTVITEVRSQAVATGHVSAEIVESVSASAQTVSEFNIKNSVNYGKAASVEEAALDLGTMTIYTGKDVIFSFLMQATRLQDLKGNGFGIDPSFSLQNNSTGKQEGTRIMRISGTPLLESDQRSGIYRGNYTMTIAYN